MTHQEKHMRRALDLGEKGRGRVEPNPVVGAVIVHGKRVVGEGYHERVGGPHAEINAIRAAGDACRGATIYVTLEPCCRHGRTPPCSDALIQAGFARVVIGAPDPTQGGAVAQLREADIEVVEGVLRPECEKQNRPFFKLRLRGEPYVIAKWAMTLDGKIAAEGGDSRWVSGDESRGLVHELRDRVDAVMVGLGTVLKDDPLLTCRLPRGRNPRRIVLDGLARLPLDSNLVRTASEAKLIVAVSEVAPQERTEALRSAGCAILRIRSRALLPEGPPPGGPQPSAAPAGRLDMRQVMRELGKRELTNVLIEGGSRTFTSAFKAGVVDEVWVFVAPKFIGGRDAPPPLGALGLNLMKDARELEHVTYRQCGRDILVKGTFPPPPLAKKGEGRGEKGE